MDWFNTKRRAAFSLIEVLFAAVIFTLISTGVVVLSISSVQREARLGVDVEAQSYVEEGLEAARNIRDQDFLELVAGDHGLLLEADGWAFDGSSEIIDAYFTRVISVEEVYRDSNGDIVVSGGSLDPNTMKVTSTVSWNYKGLFPASQSLSAYLTNWSAFDWMQTTCTEFDAGSYSNTASQAAASPPADNCVVNLELVEEAGTFFVSTDIGEHGNDVVVEGNYAYVGTHKTNQGVAIIDISDISSPTLEAYVNVGARGRYLVKEGDYLYVGVEKSNQGLAVIDVSDPTSPSLEASVNIGGYGNQAVVVDDILYMGVDDSSNGFVIYDVSTPSSPSQLASLNLGSEVRNVQISGDYAYVTADDASNGFQVIDVSDPANPSVLASLDVGAAGNSVWLNSPFAYVSTESTSDSLQVLDISSPATPSVLASLDVGEEVQDMAQNGNYLYVTLDQVNPGMAVINVSSPTAPSLSYSVDVGGKGTGVTLDDDYIYAGVDTANAGLVIVGQADVSLATSGTFVSGALDTGSTDPRYNYLDWESVEAPGGSISFQIRTASTSAGLSSATWVGPDGTSATTFDTQRTAIVMDPSASGTRYFQFIIYLTSDGFTTPSVESVTVNYTP